MIAARFFAVLAAAFVAVAGAGTATADHTSKSCRLVAVAGYTGGPSVIRMISRDGRPCAIPHKTLNCTSRHVHQRVSKTKVFHPVSAPHRGHVGVHGNRVTYCGADPDRFAYKLTDRAGHTHGVHVIIARR